MNKVRQIELLAPAGNADIGVEAINHGADAVYIGAPKFSARAAAGNSLDDIRRLADYAHLFSAKVYVALNTILYDVELAKTEQIIRNCYDIGVDAMIIQDMGILKLDIPPIPLHASTQCDNRDIARIKFLENVGFSQIVLARELSLEEIHTIAKQTNVRLEAFVHGALCVSYSGQCYISQAIMGRSANRGECAQFCRMPYNLQDAEGNILSSNKHLLSLKDLNQSENLELLLDAGISSLKIEGRLKEMSYIKNITAYYRQKLDAIFEKRTDLRRASSGLVTHFFTPTPNKSFNRSFTTYFLNGRDHTLISPHTPKAIGEPIGTVKTIENNYFIFTGEKQLHNGDGICFFNAQHELQGFRVNRVEQGRVFPLEMPLLTLNTELYRNWNNDFEKILAKKSAERKIALEFLLEETPSGFSLTAIDEDKCKAVIFIDLEKKTAHNDQSENIRLQLSKLGNTLFYLNNLIVNFSNNWFIPSSILSDLRRQVGDKLILERKKQYLQPHRIIPEHFPLFPETHLSYLHNVANHQAEQFYKDCGVEDIEPAFEKKSKPTHPVMFTKYCILHEIGCCKKEKQPAKKILEPLYLLTGKNRFQLRFDCQQCMMEVN
ncbi:MAG: U32 family peptidase [Bacteroidales bacterium]|jgi:putative protease|nr:U32 family peptidase [Bacteroidales bacterium]